MVRESSPQAVAETRKAIVGAALSQGQLHQDDSIHQDALAITWCDCYPALDVSQLFILSTDLCSAAAACPIQPDCRFAAGPGAHSISSAGSICGPQAARKVKAAAMHSGIPLPRKGAYAGLSDAGGGRQMEENC